MLMLDKIANIVIIFGTAITYRWYFVVSTKGQSWKEKKKIFRFFTYLSNLFSAIVSCLILVIGTPMWLMLLRLISTSSVTVTFLTVLFFLAPHIGKELLYKDDNLYMHVIGPIVAIVSFVFFENGLAIPKVYMGIGCISVIVYAILYLWKVVFKKEWPDFYLFNQNGKWKISFALMILLGLFVSVGLSIAHNMEINLF